MAKTLLTLLLLTVGASPVCGQFYDTQYRIPGQNLMELRTDRFRIIYPERYKEEAMRSLNILEGNYRKAQSLVGGDLRAFPFIINPENDRSNGFVSPLNFRSEIELAPNTGKTMNPKSGGWLELVLPHELAHVMHFSANPPSLTRLAGLFSPDLRRAVHSAAPLGVLEGIAVYHESHNTVEQAGRGHYPYFRNQFNVLTGTENEWSMGQLYHVSDYTPPFDRHYIGGYEFTQWLEQKYGTGSIKDAVEFHYKWPFLGFGMALKHVTGYWPGQLYNQFTGDSLERENRRRSRIAETTDLHAREVPFAGSCKRLNRPLWLDSDTVLFYGRTCNRPSGFYRYNRRQQTTEFLHEVVITPDARYSLSADREHLVYSAYHADLRYDNLYRGDLHRFSFSTGESKRLTRNARLISPAFAENGIAALQTEADRMKMILANPDGEIIREFSKPDDATVVQVAPNPANPGEAAVIGRIKSVQAVWFENLSENKGLFRGEPDIVFSDGSVFDLSWHPGGDRLIFVSDHTGTLDVYEYNRTLDRVRQLTQSRFNAFEATYSPDGNTIAYIGQGQQEQTLFLLDASRATGRILPAQKWTSNRHIAAQLARPVLNADPSNQITEPDVETDVFREGPGWLKPRLWLPVVERDNGMNRIGMNLHGVDQLNTRAWSAEVNHFAERGWYRFNYIDKQFFPGFRAELFNEPSFAVFDAAPDNTGESQNQTGQDNVDHDTVTLIRQNRGMAVRMPVPLRLRSNPRFTSFLLEPQYFLTQIRFLDPDNSSKPVSGFGVRHTAGLRTVLNLNLRQYIRDVQPNSGWVMFAEGRYGLNRDEIRIKSDRIDVDGNLLQRKGARAGLITYLSPLSRWNQSLRLSLEIYTQTEVPVFNIQDRYSGGFTESPFSRANNIGLFGTRYTIPLVYPDNGGLLLPGYLSNIYLVLFTQTAADLNQPDLLPDSRTVYGAGIRSRFRLSNLAFDVGISLGWEPTRNELTFHFGSF